MTAPFVSVVVPSYRRPEALERCIEALAGQDHPRDRFEVIVVDDASPAPPRACAERWSDSLDLTLLELPTNGGPALARNAGAARARGELLAFTDDDCTPRPDWLQCLAARFRSDGPRVAIGGHTRNALADNPYAAASQILVDYLYDYHEHGGGLRFFTSNNLALPTELFREVGGFPERFPLAAGEDRELCDRLAQHGFGLVYAPEAVVEHHHALDFRRFVRQHFHYGRGACLFQDARSERGLRTRVEPLAFYTGLFAYPGRHSRGGLGVSSLLAVSQVANALGFFWQRWTQRPESGSAR